MPVIKPLVTIRAAITLFMRCFYLPMAVSLFNIQFYLNLAQTWHKFKTWRKMALNMAGGIVNMARAMF